MEMIVYTFWIAVVLTTAVSFIKTLLMPTTDLD
jgi:hypothetical protein